MDSNIDRPTTDAEILATLQALQREIAGLRADVARIEATQEQRAELWDEMMPIGKLALESAARRLEELEQKGVLAFGRELVGVGERIVEAFGPDDVRALGDSVVSILTTVRTWTQPGMLSLAQEAGAAVESVRPDDKLGVFGMLAASRDNDVQHGAALAIGVLRRLGRAARAGANRSGPTPGRPAGWNRLAAKLGPSGAVSPRPRPAPVRPTVARAAQQVTLSSSSSTPSGGADACEPKVMGPVHAIPAGYERLPWDAEGYLADASAWTEALGAALAGQHGLPLDPPRLAIIQAARSHHASAGVAPNVRKLGLVAGVSTRDLYALFPDRPGSTVARVAGLPKPVGCI